MTNVSFDGRFLFRHKSCEVRWGVIRKKQSDLRYNADMTGGGLVGRVQLLQPVIIQTKTNNFTR